MRRFRTRALLGLTTVLASAAGAQEYSWQLSAGGSSDETGDFREADDWTVGATYYFRPVDERAGPYALAPFLDRSSFVSAAYTESKATIGTSLAAGIVDRARSTTVDGRYVWRTAGWYAGGAATDGSSDEPTSTPLGSSSDESQSLSVVVGKYLAPATALELSLGRTETESQSEVLVCAICGDLERLLFRHRIDTETIELAARHVGGAGKLRYALSGGVQSSKTELRDVLESPLTFLPVPSFNGPPPGAVSAYVSPFATLVDETTLELERRERYAVAAELFPTKALGIGIGYARWDGESPAGEVYTLSAAWFFRRNVAVELVLGTTRDDDTDPWAVDRDTDTAALRLIGRL